MSPSLRVLMIVQNNPVPWDQRVWSEALSLKAQGYSVSVICPRGRGLAGFEVLDGVHIYRYAAPPEARGAAGYALEYAYCWIRTFVISLRVAMSRGFDVIHAGNPPDIFWSLALFYRLGGKKFVFDQHDLCPEVFLSRFDGGHRLFHDALLWLERRTYAAADMVLSTNESYRDVALRRGGLSAERVYVVANYPDVTGLDRISPDDSLRGDSPFLVCCVGVLNPQDGVDYLVRAAEHLVHERHREDVRFAVLGAGDDLSRLQRMAQEMQLGDSFLFTGLVEHGQLLRYVAAADVCVSPDPSSPLNDLSSSRTVMEYMALGRPVVAFDLQETRRTADSAALYARPNDPLDLAAKIEELLADDAMRARMGEEGRQRVYKELNWDVSERELARAYRALTGD